MSYEAPSAPDWSYVLDVVLPRLGMWTGKSTYERAVCFVTGFDVARGGQGHPLLQRWADNQYGHTNIGWPWVLIRLVLQIPRDQLDGHDLGSLSPEADKAALQLLSLDPPV